MTLPNLVRLSISTTDVYALFRHHDLPMSRLALPALLVEVEGIAVG